MVNKVSKKRTTVVVILIAIITFGTVAMLAKNVNSEAEIIGQKDGPTAIWISE